MTVTLKQAALPVDFLIIGGGVAGLACAIALRRVGHRATVLEKNSNVDQPIGGARLPPNLSKILFHWGLEKELKAISCKSRAIHLLLCETGECLGRHRWDEEMLKETRGEFLAAYHGNFRKLLYDVAISYGVKIRLGCEVSRVDPENVVVTLTSGESLRGDVIVGADGVNGVSRPLLTDNPNGNLGDFNMYSTTVPRKKIEKEPILNFIYDQELTSMFSWWGNGRIVLIFPIAQSPDYGMYVYGPRDGHENTWGNVTVRDGMNAVLSHCAPQLQKLGELSTTPVCVNVRQYDDLEEWVHDSGRLVLIGEAAHPLPTGAIQQSSMAVEDGAVLAKLFSHLRSPDQIGSLLWAFQDLRQPRCSAVYKKEMGDIHFMTIPPSPMQEGRDDAMRAKRDAGIDALASTDEHEETPEWEEIKEVFGYDAEDEADDWWVKWGLLRECAKGADVAFGPTNGIVMTQERRPASSM